MAKDEAYQLAEEKTQQALKSAATELDLSQDRINTNKNSIKMNRPYESIH